jgi:rubrerythrin
MSNLRTIREDEEKELAALRQQIEKVEQCKNILEKVKEAWTPDKRSFEEAEAESKGQAWICPRCGKVHSWLSMTCDCEPKTVTSTTY